MNYKIAAVVVALVLVGGWFRSEMKAAEARGQAALLAEQSDSLYQALQDSSEAWASKEAQWDSTRQALQADLDAQKGMTRVAREGALEVVSAARSRVRQLLDSMAVLTRADAELVVAGFDSLETANELCDGALESCEEIVQASDARIWELEAQVRDVMRVTDQQAVTIERLQDVRQPSIGWAGYLGWGAAAVIAVVAVVH